MPSQIGHCDEEFWYHLILFSRFRIGNESSRNLMKYIFPFKVDQGNCPTYVYWPDYPETSVFRSDVQTLHAGDAVGQHIIHPQLSFLSDLKRSKLFYFVRKFVDIGNNYLLPQRMKNSFSGFRNGSSERLISLMESPI
jgi:hypothetical protein